MTLRQCRYRVGADTQDSGDGSFAYEHSTATREVPAFFTPSGNVTLTVPVLQSILLADHIYIDASTNKKVIAGTFNRIRALHVPGHFPRTTWAYLCLTDVTVPVELALRYVDLRTNQVLMGLGGINAQAKSPLDNVECVVEVPPLPLPHRGVFAFEAHCCGQLLGAVRIVVEENPRDQS
jgi:hypothetical protein